MINKFHTVVPHKLYRGSSPSPKDVKHLKEQLGIKKIVSLDQKTGERIDRVCKLLGIQHVKMYINPGRKSLLHFVSQDLKKLFLEGGPTFVHCHYGKDRTGLACALVKCKYLGESPDKAITEAKSLGFGVGLPPEVTHLYENIIRSCKKSKDENSADIVSNEQEYKGDNRDSPLDEGHQGSFAPFLDGGIRQYPFDSVYNYINDQSQTRQNYHHNEALQETPDSEKATTPQVGEYDNAAGLYGTGPVFPAGGFIND
jgi:hypothetical protein